MSPLLVQILLSLLSAVAGVVVKHLYPNLPVPLLPSPNSAPTPAPAPVPASPAAHPILQKLTQAGEAWLKQKEQAAEQELIAALMNNLQLPTVPAAPAAPASPAAKS